MRLRTTLHDQGEEGRPSLLAFYVCLMLAAKYLGVNGAQSAADWPYALYEQFIGCQTGQTAALPTPSESLLILL